MVKTASVNKVSKKRMGSTAAAYMAGFLDGEGTVTLIRSTRWKARSGFRYQPCLSLSNTHLGVLEHLVRSCGNGRLVASNHSDTPTHKVGYHVRFTSNQIRHVLPQLLPYLIIKKQQAVLLLKFLDLRTIGRHLSDDDYLTTEGIRQQLQALNRKGNEPSVAKAVWDAIRPSRLGNNQWVKA